MRFPDRMLSYGSAKMYFLLRGKGDMRSAHNFGAVYGVYSTKVSSLNMPPEHPCNVTAEKSDVTGCIVKFIEKEVGCRTHMAGSDITKPREQN